MNHTYQHLTYFAKNENYLFIKYHSAQQPLLDSAGSEGKYLLANHASKSPEVATVFIEHGV